MTFSGCLSIFNKLEKIVVSADNDTIKQGESVNLSAKGFGKNNKEIPLSKLQWKLNDETLGELETDGSKAVFTANENAEGKVKITVSQGKVSDSIEITIEKADEEPEPEPVNREQLEQLINEAETLLDETTVGDEPGQVSEAAHTALQAAIDEAKGVLNDPEADQDTIDSAVVAINTAVAEFIEAIIKEDSTLIISEDFTGLTSIDDFWKASYKSLPGDPDQPMYKLTGGKITLENGMLVLDGARFTIGMPSDRAETTDADTDAGGTFDLSKSYKITVEYDTVSGELSKKFQIYIDNNTTSAGKSIHASKGSTASRPYSVSLEALPENGVIEVTPNVGTENSFIQLRVESSAIIKIKSFKVEYL